MTTVAPNTDDLPTKDTGTMAVNRRAPYTQDEREFARREGLTRLETRYVLVDTPRHETFKTPDGTSYRSAGSLYVRPCKDGELRFVAYMHADTVHHDFLYFDRVINNARFGRMAGWDRYTFKNGDEGWIFDYPNYHIDGLDEFKPAHVIVEEPSDGAGHVGYGSSWGYPCTDSRCREEFHEHETADHTLESLEYDLTSRGSIEIEICKDMRAPDSDWYLNVWTGGDLTELTPEQVARFANDLQWMGIECANANSRARILRRNPEVTAVLMERDA